MRKGILAMLLFLCAVGASGNAEAAGDAKPLLKTHVPKPCLYEILNYDLDTMRPVKKAVDAGDMDAARRALLEAFRTRPLAEKPRPTKSANTTEADEILNGVYKWGGGNTYRVRPGLEGIKDIEWYKVPMDIYWPVYDHEIGRHTFITPLARAYRDTGDEKYARHLIAMMLEYLRDCDVEDGRAMPRIDNMDGLAVRTIGREALATDGHPAIQWTQMAAMRALERWPNALELCIHSPSFTPEVLEKFLVSMVERQRYLVDALPFSGLGNHGTRTPTTVLGVAVRLPEIAERTQWADGAIAALLERYNWYSLDNPKGFVYPDGATVEVSPVVAGGDYYTLCMAIDRIRAIGRDVPDQLITVRDQMAEYLAYMTWPDRFRAYRHKPRKRPDGLDRPDIDYILSGGATGTKPEHASYPMRSGDPYYAGTYFMRTDWSDDATVLRVRFGPVQYKYSQFGLGDVGDIGIWSHGLHVIPHIYVHPRTGDFLAYGDRSFKGHGRSENTISVDGVGQNRSDRSRRVNQPLENPWLTTPVFDFVAGEYHFDGAAKGLTHRRGVLFVKPDYFLILDRIAGDDASHAWRMKYQLHRDLEARIDGVRAVGVDGSDPRVVVAPTRSDIALEVVKGRKEEPREGWHMVSESDIQPAPALIYQWREPASACIETMIAPVAPGGPAPDFRIDRQTSGDAVSLSIQWADGRRDTLWIGPNDTFSLLRADAAGSLQSAARVGAQPLRDKAVSIESRKPGAVWVRRVADGQYQSASDCAAKATLPGVRVDAVEWQHVK